MKRLTNDEKGKTTRKVKTRSGSYSGSRSKSNGRRKLGRNRATREEKNKNSGKSRLSEKQDSSQELILLEENIGGIRQQKNRGTRETQESVNKTLTKTTDKIQKPVVDYSKKICVLLNKNIKLIIIEAYTEMSSGMQDRLSRIDLEKVK